MKVLIVDDSVVFRSAITSALEGVSSIKEIQSVNNGKECINFLKEHPDTDLITLDIEMPVMDGLTTLKEIRKFNSDVNVIVFSASSEISANKTILALEYGADDFLVKTSGNGDISATVNQIKEDLLPMIEVSLEKKSSKNPRETREGKKIKKSLNTDAGLFVIGASTGGPDVLSRIFSEAKGGSNVPIIIVQHMPPIFTAKLAEMLNNKSEINVVEAKNGDKLENNKAYIVPGDYHMEVEKDGSSYFIKLNQNEKVCHVRPAVDVTLKSLAKNYKSKFITVILTGMGNDGEAGSKDCSKRGLSVYYQEQETCAVWGMPRAVCRNVPGSEEIKIEEVSFLLTNISRKTL